MKDGRRKITNISEVTGIEDNKIALNTVFEFHSEIIDEDGVVHGEFSSGKKMPEILEKIINAGITDIRELFIKSKK